MFHMYYPYIQVVPVASAVKACHIYVYACYASSL